MNKEFRMIVALSLCIILSAGMLVACAEKTPAGETTAAAENTAGRPEQPENTTISQTAETVENTTVSANVGESIPGEVANPFDDPEKIATDGYHSGGSNDEPTAGTEQMSGGNPGNASGGNTATTAPVSSTVHSADSSTAATEAPASGGNQTEIVVPITPATSVTATSDTSSESDQTEDPTIPPEESGDGSGESVAGITYEEYMNMSGAEQMAYCQSFASIEDYFAWYNAAKAEYDRQNPSIEIEGGNIDLGDIIGGN